MVNCNWVNNLIVVAFFLFELCNAIDLKSCKFDQIYLLGDSLGDTGNFIRETPKSAFAKLPYGDSFPDKKPTGRCSDGQLIIDYIAMSSGLPFVPPYKDLSADTRHGDNFATAGATALTGQMLAAKKVKPVYTWTSLDEQLGFMFTHFNSICLRDCKEILKSALFLVGEFGFNDYSFALLQGKSLQDTRSLVPDVVLQIQKGARTVIGYGAVKIVVPGIFPLGCFPVHLTKFSSNKTEYDEYGCLKSLNKLSTYHNQQLGAAIAEVQKENNNVTIVYGDYYNAYISLLTNAKKSGSDIKSMDQACCGTGGKYNFDLNKMCGYSGASVCANPETYIHWDGLHLTQRAQKEIAQSFIDSFVPKLKCDA